MKTCSKCKAVKPLTEFYKHKTGKDGVDQKCVRCVKERVDAYRKANVEKIREYQAAYRKANVEKIREINAVYRKENPEKARELWVKWSKANSEKIRARHAVYRKENSEKIREFAAKWCKAESESLSNRYVSKRISTKTNLKATDIPQELIELKRVQLQIIRQLRELNHV